MTDDLMVLLREASRRSANDAWAPEILYPGRDADRARLESLLGTPGINVFDPVPEELGELVRTRRPAHTFAPDEVAAAVEAVLAGSPVEYFGAWAHYPWSKRLVHVLPEALHREMRTDRNRLLITAAEQRKLLGLRIGIAGLSVGRAISTSLLREGIGGEFRLADFDTLSLTNLNRLAGTLADIDVNKAVLAAREIAELDPYIRVQPFQEGIRPHNLETFLDGLDFLVEECDSLTMKVELRNAARRRGIPVLMATSDRGMIDIERFDREPNRSIFHGLLDDVDCTNLDGLTTKEKVPYVLRILDARGVTPRLAASLVEVKESISTWPQLASAVTLGGAMAAHAIRNITLGNSHESGRFQIDFDVLLRDGAQVPPAVPGPFVPVAALPGTANVELALPVGVVSTTRGHAPTREEFGFIVAAATRAPSGGNIQPWKFTGRDRSLVATIDPDRSTSHLNFRDRGTWLALGAALENANVAAEVLGFRATIERGQGADMHAWTLHLARTGPQQPIARLDPYLKRCSNRRTEPSPSLDVATLDSISRSGAPLLTWCITAQTQRRALGEAIGALDRVRMLAPEYHRELFNEIRADHHEALRTHDGLDLASLEFSATDLAVLDIVRSGAAMGFLGQENLGRGLGNSTRDAMAHAGAILVTGCDGADPLTVLEAGRGLQRLWVEANRLAVAVHPWGSPFLFQRALEAPETLTEWERESLLTASRAWNDVLPESAGKTILLVLRLSRVAPPTGRSLRRPVGDVLQFA